MTRESENRPGSHHALEIDPTAISGWAVPAEAPSPAARIGQVLGSYRLVEVIGCGGMGCVYRGEHVLLGRAAAIKVLHAHHAAQRDAVARLRQEARASSHIRHRNIVDILDYLEMEDGAVCVVMEYLPGQSLGRLVDKQARLPAVRALDILIQMCDGLEAAHAADIIHRDLKPDNVMVLAGPDGAPLVKILDFGVAKLLASEEGPLTAAGQVIGTPPYMSPEQAAGGEVDARADIYSLGAIMYELFTGKTPFVARSFDEYVFKHLAVPPDPPHATGVRDIDPRIESVIMRCLNKDPAARFRTASDLREELIAIRRSLTAPPRDRRRRWIAAGLAATAGLVIFAFAVAGGQPPAAEPPAAAPPAADRLGPQMLRIVSSPPATVYADGGEHALCETPCAIALSDRPDRTTYLLRRPGYLDRTISVDPAAPASQVTVRLERAAR